MNGRRFDGELMGVRPYLDRREAGRRLAGALKGRVEEGRVEEGHAERGPAEDAEGTDPLVLALPRGGVPVGLEVARALDAPLDVLLVRKLGVPSHPELAMGAIASGGARAWNDDVISDLGITEAEVEEVERAEREELERRERAYRGDRPRPEVEGRTVVLVDDGIATGSTMQAALEALRGREPARIVAAVPVAPPSSLDALRGLADQVVCPRTPEPFHAISLWYESFPQVSDEEVRECLERDAPTIADRAG